LLEKKKKKRRRAMKDKTAVSLINESTTPGTVYSVMKI
jgi:hypothetical protein